MKTPSGKRSPTSGNGRWLPRNAPEDARATLAKLRKDDQGRRAQGY
jgi:hypothetical protein